MQEIDIINRRIGQKLMQSKVFGTSGFHIGLKGLGLIGFRVYRVHKV